MMNKDLFQNIRYMRTQNSFHKVQMLHIHQKLFLVSLMEPFLDTRHVQKDKRRLGMQYAKYNQNGLNLGVCIEDHSFWGSSNFKLAIDFQDFGYSLITTTMYAKQGSLKGFSLQDYLDIVSQNCSLPWLVLVTSL